MKSTKKRTSYHHGSLRESLIAEAIHFLTERGGPHFTLRELAAKLGVSHSASYRHFEDKDSLLAAIATEGFIKMGQAQEKALSTTKGSSIERLKRLGTSYIHFAITHPGHFRVMFGAELGDKTKYPELAKASASTFEPLVNEIIQGQGSKSLRKGDPRELALMLWSTVHGLSMLAIDRQIELTGKGLKINVDALAVHLAEAILSGLRA